MNIQSDNYKVGRDRLGAAQVAVLVGLQANAAGQLMRTALAARMTDKAQQVASEVRAHGLLPSIRGAALEGGRSASLIDRLATLVRENGILVEVSHTGGERYKYQVPSGETPLPAEIQKSMMETATKLARHHDSYVDSLGVHETFKSRLFDADADKDRTHPAGEREFVRGFVDVLRDFSTASRELQERRMLYQESVRRYLADRAALVARNYDVRPVQKVVDERRALDQFLRDSIEVVRVVRQEYNPTMTSSTPSMKGAH